MLIYFFSKLNKSLLDSSLYYWNVLQYNYFSSSLNFNKGNYEVVILRAPSMNTLINKIYLNLIYCKQNKMYKFIKHDIVLNHL